VRHGQTVPGKREDGRNKNNGLGLPIERHSHAIEGESGKYLSHDAETGMFDSEPGVEDILGLTQFPSRDGRPSVDALGRVRHGSYAHEGDLTSIFCGKIFHLSSFPCCVVK